MASHVEDIAGEHYAERTVEVHIENNSKGKMLSETAMASYGADTAGEYYSERTVEVQNENNSKSKTLSETAAYNYSGHVFSPPPPIISPGGKGEAIFVKNKSAARGSVGILSYRFGVHQFSLLFSNPYDYNLYSIKFALYISETWEPTDKRLYTKMYSQLTPRKTFAKVLSSKSVALSVSGCGLMVSATMSNENHSIIKLDVRDA